MNKTTRIAGIDNKYGRKSRTGSTISMNISDIEAMECQQYLMAIEAGEEPSGRIKKIELVMYSDDDLRSEPNIVDSIETLDNVLGGQTFEDYSKDDSKLPTHEGNQKELDIYEDSE